MPRTRNKAELDATVGPAIEEATRRRPWERATERQPSPVPEEEAPAKPRPAPVKVEPVTFLYPQIPAYALGLGARICYFQHGKLTLDDAGEIADMRKHPLFGVRIFEAGKVPLEVQLGEGEGLDAHRRRLIPKPIRVQAQRSAGPYGLGPGAPQGPRMRKPGAEKSDRRNDEWT